MTGVCVQWQCSAAGEHSGVFYGMCVCSGNTLLLESTLGVYAKVLSRVKDLDDQPFFMELFTFLSMLLDKDMAAKSGKALLSLQATMLGWGGVGWGGVELLLFPRVWAVF